MFKMLKSLKAKNLILVLSHLIFFTLTGEDMRFVTARDAEIELYAHHLEKLSDSFYSLYPYFYKGSQSDEEFYNRHYSRWSAGRMIMVFDQDQPVGYIVGNLMKNIPIGNQALIDYGFSVDSLYFIGEIVLLEPYRRKYLGTKMIKDMELMAKEELGSTSICLTQIDEDFISDLKPQGYESPDGFWDKLGYQSFRNVHFQIDWINVDGLEEQHRLFYWIKSL